MEFLSNGWFYLLAALGFGFVIFIHELGHFLFAKWAGVRVDRFSIGFGPVIFKYTVGETEYALSLLPLGGYVKMLGQEDLPNEIPAESAVNPRSYLAKSAGWKAMILFAGVLFNLISSYLILLGLAWHGKPIIEPVVGEVPGIVLDRQGHVQPSPAALLGLERGDRILTYNGKPIREYDDLNMEVVTTGTQALHLQVARTQSDGTIRILDLPQDPTKQVKIKPNYESGRPELGIAPASSQVITDILPVKEGSDIGVHPMDRLVAIDGKPIPADMIGQQIDDLLLPYYGKEVTLTLNPGQRVVKLRYASNGSLDVSFPFRIENVTPGSAAEVAGLKPGDLPLSVDGIAVGGSSHFLALTRADLNANKDIHLVVLRDGAEQTIVVHGTPVNGRMLMGAGIAVDAGYLPIVPKNFDGEPSALARAGIVAGDAVVWSKTNISGNHIRSVDMQVVSDGKPVDIAMPEDDAIAFTKAHSIFPILRLFGMHADPTLSSQLIGMRVVNLGEGHGYPGPDMMNVSDVDNVSHSVGLKDLSAKTIAVLLNTLKVGDWITGMTVLGDGTRALQVVRGGAQHPRMVSVVPLDVGNVLFFGPMPTPYKLHHWTEAFTIANQAAYGMVVKTTQIIPRFFRPAEEGGIDANKTMTGPFGILVTLKGSAERFGFDYYLSLIAMIGLNLFMVNLLPIPITDGGQLVFLAIETVMRRPLPESVRVIATYIGLLLVLSLMVYVLGLDILRRTGLM